MPYQSNMERSNYNHEPNEQRTEHVSHIQLDDIDLIPNVLKIGSVQRSSTSSQELSTYSHQIYQIRRRRFRLLRVQQDPLQRPRECVA
jgi:hypothetical protein